MTEQEMKALQEMMRATVREELDATLDKKLEPIHEKLDDMSFQLDTVYKWVDRIDIDVNKMKKAL